MTKNEDIEKVRAALVLPGWEDAGVNAAALEALDRISSRLTADQKRLKELEEVVSRIAGARISYERDGRGFLWHLIGERGEYLGDAAPAFQEWARRTR